MGDITTLAPLDSALVQIVGSRSIDTTRGGGRFNLDRVPGGRSYVVRVVRPGYEIGTLPGSYFSPGISFVGIVATVDGSLMPAGGFGINLRSW